MKMVAISLCSEVDGSSSCVFDNKYKGGSIFRCEEIVEKVLEYGVVLGGVAILPLIGVVFERSLIMLLDFVDGDN